MPTPKAYLFSPQEHSQLIPDLAALHKSCIIHDQTIAYFLPPLEDAKLQKYWEDVVKEIDSGTRFISILLNESESGTKAKGSELVGVITLIMPPSETGPFRGIVEKLFVSPDFRGKGGSRLLMNHLEAEALKRGRTLLMLDTEIGSAAEKVYPRLGFTEVGRIPRYGISPAGGLKDEVFYYKHLQVKEEGNR
ncbi:acyl-CoA N-acyltransferase [Hypoxylon trugodes]|uniref:acyl-CoA N-acyltransferase n=1 Tax=Hypoxylon trugodes TaxID=326681 RepID=UPI00219FC857|nr:acyl-CoA N-acyltransferase [Hypoxylon trugodes]KAI1386393.1 acyl-CoA N-acyltransferase [Hypoxylon trugodes]